MKTLKIMMGAMLIVLGLAACSNKEEAVKVADKIEQGDALTQGDYTTIIEYMGKFAEEAQPIQNRINDMSADNPEAARLTARIDSMRNANPYLDTFTTTLCKADQKELGGDNVALVNKYAGYEWFTSPDWAIVTEDPGVAGMVVETPEAGSDTGVVAGAVDEETVRAL